MKICKWAPNYKANFTNENLLNNFLIGTYFLFYFSKNLEQCLQILPNNENFREIIICTPEKGFITTSFCTEKYVARTTEKHTWCSTTRKCIQTTDTTVLQNGQKHVYLLSNTPEHYLYDSCYSNDYVLEFKFWWHQVILNYIDKFYEGSEADDPSEPKSKWRRHLAWEWIKLKEFGSKSSFVILVKICLYEIAEN